MSLGDSDGWHNVPTDREYHYFYQNHSVCGLFKTIPEFAHHDNDPTKHCSTCEKKVNKLLAVAASMGGKKLTPKEMEDIIDTLDSITLNSSENAKVKTKEQTIVVVGHNNGKQTIIDNKKKKFLRVF
jgi:hypothetical protein